MNYWTSHQRHIVIVGGGFAGAVTAIKLLDSSQERLGITIIEPREDLGRGVAYSTSESVHLVNAPAHVFSLHNDDPDHFANWLETRETGLTPEGGGFAATFVPRWIYGTYIGDELARAVAHAKGRATLRHVRARATEVRRSGGRLHVTLSNGEVLPADEVVLALGVFKPQPRKDEAAVTNHSLMVSNPWNPAVLDRIIDARELLLIGTSLSMVDVVASMEARGFRGRYKAISRRGHIVEARAEVDGVRDFFEGAPLPRTALELLTRVKAERRAIAAKGGNWRTMLQTLRPRIAELWRNASTRERLRFARHLRSLWDVTLHQAAPPSRIWLEKAEQEGRFTFAAGRLLQLDHDGTRFSAKIKWRHGGIETAAFDAVVDCRGHQEHDWRRVDDPFVQSLLAEGLVRPHDTGYGIDATSQGAVIDRSGAVVPGLYAIGHPLRGVAWESSSIPEQLAQATALAELLSANQTAPLPVDENGYYVPTTLSSSSFGGGRK
jgi:uncharacterized NAD(P)/FAD-binding protein YdhS